MKIVAIGDIHGLTTRKDVLEKERDFDLCVFIGDYFDNKDGISGQDEIENFEEIRNLAKNDKRIILLLGNHDRHYIEGVKQRFSGYDGVKGLLVGPILTSMWNNSEIRPRYVVGNIIFSHAGITNTRASKHNIDIKNYEQDDKLLDDLSFQYTGPNDTSGTSIFQGPLRVRPGYITEFTYNGEQMHQIVGHTRTWDIYTKNGVTFIDSLRSGQYLVVQDGTQIVVQI